MSGKQRRRNDANAGRRALAEIRRLQQQIEVKHDDITYAGSPLSVDVSGIIGILLSTAEGAEPDQRVGQSMTVKKIQLGYQLDFSDQYDYVTYFRFIVFRDRQTLYNNPPTVTSVLRDATVYSNWNSQYIGRFEILHDKLYKSQPRIATEGDKIVERKTIVFPKGLDVEFFSTGTSYAKNGLFFLAISTQSTNAPTIRLFTQAEYTDL